MLFSRSQSIGRKQTSVLCWSLFNGISTPHISYLMLEFDSFVFLIIFKTLFSTFHRNNFLIALFHKAIIIIFSHLYSIKYSYLILIISKKKNFIWRIDVTLISTTSPVNSWLGSNVNEWLLRTPQISWVGSLIDLLATWPVIDYICTYN